MKVRVRFEKKGVLKYVGHLDMMRYFQKAISRANLPIAYSEGFNPHQIMSFGNPLGLGMTSSAEYMDIELLEEIPSLEGINRLNNEMVPGIKILSFRYLPDKAKNAMSATWASSYKIRLSDKLKAELGDMTNISHRIDDFMSLDECIITKKTKKSTRELDILPLIYEFKYEEKYFYIKCSSSSGDNIKPEVIMNEFFKYLGYELELDRVNLSIERLDIYTLEDENLISLDDIGVNK
ncbi:MAG: DUF2344 domain-containing protein [Lachnospiraceae bacterium]|nr:DUF2344 domain-containing protein [Lachnospiraceae bacterium]